MKQKKFLIAAIGLSLIAPSIFAQTFVAGGLQYTIDGDSAVVKANSKADESIKAAGKTLYILPQKGMIELESLSFQGKIRIFSATGESMQVITLKRGSKTVCSLSAGIYIIDADGISAMKVAVK